MLIWGRGYQFSMNIKPSSSSSRASSCQCLNSLRLYSFAPSILPASTPARWSQQIVWFLEVLPLLSFAYTPIIARFFSKVNTFLKKYQKVIHSPIVVMVEKLGLYSQALELYQKTSLCKALMLRYSKTLMFRPQRANFFRLMLTPYVVRTRLCFPLCQGYRLGVRQSAFPLCQRPTHAFQTLYPYCIKGWFRCQQQFHQKLQIRLSKGLHRVGCFRF